MNNIRDIAVWPAPRPTAPYRGDADLDSDEVLAIYHDSLPNCPTCGDKITIAHQLIRRSGEILRIDGKGDAELKEYEEYSYKTAVILECAGCGDFFRPQHGFETYTQAEAEKLFDVPEKVSEDGEFEGSEELW